VIGSTLRVPARFAAFANGLTIHADDYDDTQLAIAKDRVYGLLTHPTAPALPPVLALAERDRRSGLDMMLAYQVGVEVECKVAEAIAPRHYQTGFHSTGDLRLHRRGGRRREAARPRSRGHAARDLHRRNAGRRMRENFGTMTKPFHAGRAARTASWPRKSRRWLHRLANGLEADRGFFRAAGGGYRRERHHGKLGDPWTFPFPGVSIKPHPSVRSRIRA
jgi:hypothetical protein